MIPTLNLAQSLTSGPIDVASASYSYFDPSDKGTNASLSDSNKVVTASSDGSTQVNSVTAKSSGKWRVQFVLTNFETEVGVGFTTAAVSSNGTYLGKVAAGWGLWGNYSGTLRRHHSGGWLNYSGSYADGDTVDLLIDIDNGMAWWAHNGTVVSGDPAAGTGAMATFTASSTVELAANPYFSSGSVRLRTNPSEMSGSSVSGFTDGWPA